MKLIPIALLATTVFLTVAWKEVPRDSNKDEFTNHWTTMRGWRHPAPKGDADVQYRLGLHFSYVERNFAKATKWLRLAAERGDARAQYQLAEFTYLGLGVPENRAEAFVLYGKAAEQGLSIAAYHIAAAHYYGAGVTQSYAEAAKWYLEAAKSGLPMALVDLAHLYKQGLGVAQNYAEAARLYHLACQMRGDEALYTTGLFRQGEAARPSFLADRFRFQIEMTLRRAKASLGTLYAHGWGVPRDLVRAYMWLSLADAQRGNSASGFLNSMAKLMTPLQIAEAEKLAEDWQPNQ